MIFYILIFIGLMAFLSGYFLGSIDIAKTEPKKTIKAKIQTDELIEEYRNFLNYDGSEQ